MNLIPLWLRRFIWTDNDPRSKAPAAREPDRSGWTPPQPMPPARPLSGWTPPRPLPPSPRPGPSMARGPYVTAAQSYPAPSPAYVRETEDNNGMLLAALVLSQSQSSSSSQGPGERGVVPDQPAFVPSDLKFVASEVVPTDDGVTLTIEPITPAPSPTYTAVESPVESPSPAPAPYEAPSPAPYESPAPAPYESPAPSPSYDSGSSWSSND